jgi:transcriptional regulator with XRE-family HTH domain
VYTFIVTTAEAIAKLRSKIGLTQLEFSEKLGVTITSISRYENGREPNRKVLQALAVMAESAGLDYLRDIFSAKRQADIVARVERLPSTGTARRIPFNELGRWRAMADFIAERLIKVRSEYVEIIQRQKLSSDDLRQFHATNHEAFALKGVLQDLARELTPYIDGPNARTDAKK